jgi:Na+/melibiose symporter-like transporter
LSESTKPTPAPEEAPVQYSRQRDRNGKVPITTKLYQGIGALPGSHKDFAFNTFLLLYYSQILGVPASFTSVVLAIALVVDAVTDPMVGAYSDNFRSRLGRRHPFMYAAALPLGVCMYLLFSPPDNPSETVLLVWLLAFTLLVRLAFTFFVVPWNAVAAEFSSDYVERTSIITYRYLVGWIGGTIFTFSVYSLVFSPTAEYPAGQLNPDNYPTFAIVVAGFITLWALLTTHLTKREVPYLLQPVKPTPKFELKKIAAQVLLALRSSNFRLLFICTLLFAGIAGVGQVFDIYMNTYYWEFKPADLRWYGLTILGAMIAFATVPVYQRKFEKQDILVVAIGVACILPIIKVTFRFLDIWPDNGDPLLLVLFIILAIFVVYALTTAGIMFGSMIADLVDEQEFTVHRRQEGVYSSAIGFSAKATSSLGLIVGGLLLDAVISFPRGTAVGEVADPTLFRLALTDGIVVPMFFLIPILMLRGYSLTRSRLEDIQDSLAERR